LWMTRWITLRPALEPWGLSTLVHENPKAAAIFESIVHRTAHTNVLWLM
jgi:hypothetical protein